MEFELAKKARPIRTDPESLVQAAEKAVGRIRADYVPRLIADVRDAEDLLGDVQDGRAPLEDALREIHGIMHETAGLAGTFGFPRVSEVAHSLCRLLREVGEADERVYHVVRLHVGALSAVLKRRGDASPVIDMEVVDGLRQAVDTIIGTESA